MKNKIIITIVSSLFLISLHAQKPPIGGHAEDVKISMVAKISESTVFSKCNGFTDPKPVKITSSTGAQGYYCQCNATNAVIFYLVNQKLSVFNYGDIRTKYATQDYERGSLGFPLQDAKGIAGLRGGYQVFEGGCIYLIFHASPDKKSSAAFIIKGGFYKKFLALGGDKAIGLPISDEEDDKSAGGEAGDKSPQGIISQSFEKGTITKKGNIMDYASYSSKPPIRTPGSKENTTTGRPPIRSPKNTKSTDKNILVNPGEILATAYLEKDKPYYSQDNRYKLIFQADGNLVLYKVPTNKAIWSTHTSGTAVKSCIMQGDGNLVLYGYKDQHVWYSDKEYDGSWLSKALGEGDQFKTGGPVYKLIVQNDGNLVIYACDKDGHASAGSVRWSSHSWEKN